MNAVTPGNPPETPAEQAYSDLFKAPSSLRPCSMASCSAGHEWQPTIATTKCPGCASPILVLKMQQCPTCNEPSVSLRLRTDHLPQGGTITPVCQGSASLAEVIEIVIEQRHAQDEEASHKEREVLSKT